MAITATLSTLGKLNMKNRSKFVFAISALSLFAGCSQQANNNQETSQSLAVPAAESRAFEKVGIVNYTKSAIVGAWLPTTTEGRAVINGGKLILEGLATSKKADILDLKYINMNLLVPGFTPQSPKGDAEHVHAVQFEASEAKIGKIKGGSHAGFSSYTVEFASGTKMKLTTEGDTQMVALKSMAFSFGGSDEVNVTFKYEPVDGVEDELSFTLLGFEI